LVALLINSFIFSLLFREVIAYVNSVRQCLQNLKRICEKALK